MTAPSASTGAETRRTFAISGASGLIGSALAAALRADGHAVLRLVRRPARHADEVEWHPHRGDIDAAKLAAADVIVNLAGESLSQRWTDPVKREIRQSRVTSTAVLARTMVALPPRPRVLLSGSAIGIYGNRGDELLDESSTLGTDFLATVCRDWEAAAQPAADAGVRVVHLRTGLALDKHGGLLQKFLLPFRMGVGGRLGNGRQWMSWIAMADMVGAIRHVARDETVRGPVNLVAPNPVTNEEFTRALAHELHRPSLFPVPRFAMKLAFGEMADAAALASQRVQPRRLMEAGYAFRLPMLDQALASILS